MVMSIEAIYQKCGIRRINQFQSPPLVSINDFRLIQDCIIHFLPYGESFDGPIPSDTLIYQLIKRRGNIFIDHVLSFDKPLGNPIGTLVNSNRVIGDYQRQYRMFRLLRNPKSVLNSSNASVLINYCLLHKLYRYNKTPISDFQKEANVYKRVFELSDHYSQLTDRAQFIECQLPENLLSVSEYDRLLSKEIKYILPSISVKDYCILLIFNFISRAKNEAFDLMTGFDNIYFYWNIDNRIVMLSASVLNDFADKSEKETKTKFIDFMGVLIEQFITQSQIINDKQIIETNIDEPVESEIDRIAQTLYDSNAISEREKTRFNKLAIKYKSIDNPFGKGSLEELVSDFDKKSIVLEDKPIIDLPTILDKSMTKSTLVDFDKQYINECYQKDVARMIINFQRAGIAVTNYQVDEIKDATTRCYRYKVQFTPMDGSPSTIEFKLPKLDQDGTFTANNIKSKMDKQRMDMPIRKVSSDRVSLTSYYGKLFVDRDSRGVNNYSRWICSKIIGFYESSENIVSHVAVGNVIDSEAKVPRVYSAIAQRIKSFTYKSYKLYFEYKSRQSLLKNTKLGDIEKNNKVLCGTKGDGLVSVDDNERFYLHEKGKISVIGSINDLMDNRLGKGPIEFVTIFNMGKKVPLGVVLSYRYGLKNLLKKLKLTYRIERLARHTIEDNEFVIRFNDARLIVKDTDKKATLIIAGFLLYKKEIQKVNIDDLDNKDIYLNIISNFGMTIRYLKEINLLFQLFIDPITLELLKSMNEPTSMDGLFLRSAELLVSDDHPRETDMAYMRIRGYERISGAVYFELIKCVRGYTHSPPMSTRKIEMNPKAVWMNILTDGSVSKVNETNPIQQLKEMEKVSYGGLGGRDTRTMVRRTREFHPNDQGVISESTTDNSKAGIIAYTTADPNLINVRGVTNTLSDNDGTARQVSTTFLVSPCADRDEGKRINMASIQYTHTISIEGNQIQPIRTGYESVIAHRCSPLYASVAQSDGVIKAINDNALSVEYKDKTKQHFLLGKQIASTPGMNLVHPLITDRSVGYKFKKGEILSYNKGFFKRDMFNPTQVCFLMGTVARVALLESSDTLEDSCAISKRLTQAMATNRTQVRNIIINFDQSIHSLVKIGDSVEIDTPLCIIEDALTADIEEDIFDAEAINSIGILAANSPKAKYKGVIEHINVLYYGKIDEMSDSLKKIAREYDRKREKRNSELGLDDVPYNRVDQEISFDGVKTPYKSFIIQVYISNTELMGVGDKGVFYNQLKTIVGRIMDGVNESEDGEPIDAIFGFQSISNRVVLSPQLVGTAAGALKAIGRHACKLYFKRE